MTTSHSSGRRHRGRRGRRSGNRAPGQQPNPEQQTPEAPEVVEAVVLPDLADESAPEPQLTFETQHGPLPRPRPDSRPPMRPARRRPQPRQAVGPMPMEVLKRGLQLQEPEFPLQLRPVATMIEGTVANFGCPMLHRNQVALPSTGNLRAARCSLGWSIHNQDEAMLCMYTAEMIDCWKAHPEKVEGLVAQIQQDEESAAAD